MLPRAAIVLALSLAAAVARANVMPPPTGLVDVFHLGLPGGIAALVALLALAIFVRQRRKAAGKRFATLLAVAIFVAGNLAAYTFWLMVINPRERAARFQERERERVLSPPSPAP